MFGRRDEDYEEYNERYAAKFDDDYIAPSRDYRRECTHSHEQTYDDIDDLRECGHDHEQTYQNVTEVKECNHSHEQTYDDADYEQHSYDKEAAKRNSYASVNDIESIFTPYLAQGEHLLWAGGDGKLDQLNAGAQKNVSGSATVLIILGIVLIFSCIGTVVGIVLFVIGLMVAAKNTSGFIAVTDRRIIVRFNEGSKNIWLSTIKEITVTSTNRRTGKLRMLLDENAVSFDTNRRFSNGQNSSMSYYISPGIEYPERVKQIIEDAILSARLNKYE